MPTTQDLVYRVSVNDSQLDGLIAKTLTLNQAIVGTQHASKALDVQLRAQGRRFTEIGRYMTRNFTQPMALAAAGAVKLGYDFDKSLGKVQSLAGATASEMDGLRKQVFKMGMQTPTSVTELADALYFIRSSGIEASKAMGVLEASNKAAVAGLGDVKTVADTVTSAMNAYGPSVLKAQQATDILLATVRVGKAEPAELARSIGRVIPIAEQMGVSFAEVGGSIAALTLSGLSADLAVTGLRATLQTFMKGLKPTRSGLAMLGVSFDAVQKSIGDRGLQTTLQALRYGVMDFAKKGGKVSTDAMNKLAAESDEGAKAIAKLKIQVGATATSLLAKLFPNVKALNAFLILTKRNGADAARTLREVKDSSKGETERAFAAAMSQRWAQLALALNQLRTQITKIGYDLLPIFTTIAKGFGLLFQGFNALPGPLKQLIGMNVALLGLVGPLLIGYGQLIRISSLRAIRAAKDGKIIAGSHAQEAAAATGAAGAETKLAATTATVGKARAAALASMRAAYLQQIAEVETMIRQINRLDAEEVESAAVFKGSETAKRIELLKTNQVLFGGAVPLYRQGPYTGPYTGPSAGGERGAAGKITPGMTGPGGAPIIFGPGSLPGKDMTDELRKAQKQMEAINASGKGVATQMGRTRTAITSLRGALGGVAASAVAAGGAIRLALAPFWPLLAIEALTLLILHWDGVSRATYKATQRVGDYLAEVKKVPGAGFLKGIGGAIKGSYEEHTPKFMQDVNKVIFGGVSKALYDNGRNLEKQAAKAKESMKGVTDETKNLAKQLGMTPQEAQALLKSLGMSAEELRNMLGLTDGLAGKLSKAAQEARSLFQDAFQTLTGDIQTAFDARTDLMAEGFDRKTSDMLDVFDQRSSDTWDAMAQKFDDATEKMIKNLKVKVKVLGKSFTITQEGLTPAERELKALEKAIDRRQAYRALGEAGRELREATLIGDPYAMQEAQDKAEDARTEIRKGALTARAEVERRAADDAIAKEEERIRRTRAAEQKADQRAYDARRAESRRQFEDQRAALRRELIAARNLEWRHLEKRLKSLALQLEKRQITIGVFRKKLEGLMGEFGVTASDGAALIATSFGKQMEESLRDLQTVIDRHAKHLGNKQKEMAAAAEAAAKRMRDANLMIGNSSTAAATAVGKAASKIMRAWAKVPSWMPPFPGAPGAPQTPGAPGSYTAPKGGTRVYPFAAGVQTNVIGTPFSGTHTLGNWQSDQALDISASPGTTVLAVAAGTVAKITYNESTSGRFFGNAITINGDDGTQWFYKHVRKIFVNVGQHVRVGAPIATVSKWTGGSPHLHIAASKVSAIRALTLAPKATRAAATTAPRTYTAPRKPGSPTGPDPGGAGGAGAAFSLSTGSAAEIRDARAAGVSPARIAQAIRNFRATRGMSKALATARGLRGRFFRPLPPFIPYTTARQRRGMRQIPGIPRWIQPEAHRTLQQFARQSVLSNRLSWLQARGMKVTKKDYMAALPPQLIKTLSPAQRKRLGPDGLATYLQKMAGIVSSPAQAGLIKTRGSDQPWALGPGGLTGNVQNVNINIYEAGSPKKTAAEVRNVLLKTAARNAKTTRGRNRNQKVGLS